MITREEALKWLRNHPEETGDGFYMASAIVDLHDENATILANAQRITAQYAAERDNLTALLRLAEASVSLLRADLEACEKVRVAALVDRGAQDLTLALVLERDAARLELRRLRAAEDPPEGHAEIEAAGGGWVAAEDIDLADDDPEKWSWFSGDNRYRIERDAMGWVLWDNHNPGVGRRFRLALDAMRDAVPGSV